MVVDVLVDIGENFLQVFRLNLGKIGLDFGVAVRADAELLLSGGRSGRLLRRRLARAPNQRHRKHERSNQPPHSHLLGQNWSLRQRLWARDADVNPRTQM